MATYTDNLHLEKPAQSDLYNIDVFNGNADIIDSAMAARALAQNQATIESSSTASRNYSKGEYLVYNGLLYKVTSAISSGGAITPGTNCVATNTGAELKSLNDSLTNITNINVTASDNVVIDTQKSCVVAKTAYFIVKGHATAAINNSILVYFSGVTLARDSFTFPMGIGTAWGITDVGYGYVHSADIVGTVASGVYFHICIAVPAS